LQDVVKLVVHHQERWDGSGYPNGIKGGTIPLPGSELRSCVSFNALISDRPYHKKVPAQDAAEFLKFHANIQFDPRVVKAFTKFHEKPHFLRNLGYHEIVKH
jgi:HD-GYP domain-containing protein (c-di-GMP phosphodiesterase class II)